LIRTHIPCRRSSVDLDRLHRIAQRARHQHAAGRASHSDAACTASLTAAPIRRCAERLSDKEIAERLGLEPVTVQKHVQRIDGRLGVANRRAAVTQARRLGHGRVRVAFC
jgi:DNA-binding NarL/FixJ family response regulator